MSPVIKETEQTFKRIAEEADRFQKKSEGLDRELSTKIKRVKEAAQEVSTHIEKKTGGAQHGA